MEITLNGKPHSCDAPMTVAALIESLDLAGRRVAVMINDNVVSRALHAETTISADDRVEVVHMVGGG